MILHGFGHVRLWEWGRARPYHGLLELFGALSTIGTVGLVVGLTYKEESCLGPQPGQGCRGSACKPSDLRSLGLAYELDARAGKFAGLTDDLRGAS
jgi:hypothetical protein